MMIQQATRAQLQQAARLAAKLWDGHTQAELQEELDCLLDNPHAAIFLAYNQQEPVGFAQCQLRNDYVEGTNTSPVGYLEGVYVETGHRRRGIATRLLAACEAWARTKGCTQFASDCELPNKDSYQFHLGAGFREANRIICFVKDVSVNNGSETTTMAKG